MKKASNPLPPVNVRPMPPCSPPKKPYGLVWGKADGKLLEKLLVEIQHLQTVVQTGGDPTMALQRLFSMKHMCKEVREKP